MIFYHVSRPHPAYSSAGSPPLVRICATVDAEQDFMITLAVQWHQRPLAGESMADAARRVRQSTPSPSVYLPPVLHHTVPTVLLIGDHEVDVCGDMRILTRARMRRDFTPHHQGSVFNRVRLALESISNPLLLHCVQQFMRTVSLAFFRDLGLATEELRAEPPSPEVRASILTPDGTRFDPDTGEVLS